MISEVGKRVIDKVTEVGSATLFVVRALLGILRLDLRLFLMEIVKIGVGSTLVIALIGFFTGAVLAVQAEYTLTKFGATAYTGSAVALSLIRELGPVLTALMVIGRAGSAMTAELGIMKITEQIDALVSMAVDPVKYLMTPRLLTAILIMPALTGIFIAVGIFGGYFVGVGLLGLSSGTFWSQIYQAVEPQDLTGGLIKALFFGVIFGSVSTFKGYSCGSGASGVNRATTQSVVLASVLVLVFDYLLTSVLTRFFM